MSVATVWTYPSSPRTIDKPALESPARVRHWIESMSNPQKLDLVGRVQTQVLYGAKVLVLATSGAWSDVAVPGQPSNKNSAGYPGWVPTVQLTDHAPKSGRRVVITSPTAWLREPKTHDRLMELSYGTSLSVVRRTDARVEVELLDGRAAEIDPADVDGSTHDVLGEGRRFLGLPYLWGGTSGFGFDCSGFSYSVYASLGITIARDADQQFHNGRAVSLHALRPGDILFVADSSGAIVHDALYYGEVDGTPSIIESPNTGKAVRVIPLSTHRYIGARRILPS